ncbi:hypothetical protein JOF41_003072 [Saccharothrix coeruleofusca]|nr:hypothetical protein [Saccharothrix coeruleofusca]
MARSVDEGVRARPGERVRLVVALVIVCFAVVASLVASCG